jgi:hypothetical protein
MSRLTTSSELQEAVSLLDAIAEDVRRLPGQGRQSRGERLHRALVALSTRARFRGAAVADEHGLPLAVHDFPFRQEAVSAVASILGRTLHDVGSVVGRREGNMIAVDLGFDQKLAVRRLAAGGSIYYLLVLCASGTDEHAEIELSLTELCGIISPA